MSKSGSNTRGIFDTTDMNELSRVVDAVCSELGIDATDAKQRERVARRMLAKLGGRTAHAAGSRSGGPGWRALPEIGLTGNE